MTDIEKYKAFLTSKVALVPSCGFSISPEVLNPKMFQWQREVTALGIRKGRFAFFEGCGLGKSVQQLEWGHRVHLHTQGNVLALAPLAVAEQTHYEEGPKFGYQTTLCRTQSDVRDGINITNYEMMNHFDPAKFSAVICDESSILKSMDGATKQALISAWSKCQYRLCATATPSPNDVAELGNHAEFLGVMTRVEMLSMFFVHDGGDTSEWRLKGHAEQEFWKWVCSWAVVIRKPSDIGHSDEGYNLPPFRRIQVTIPAEEPTEGHLFPVEANTLRERQGARRSSIDARVKACADKVNASDRQWIIWCGLNDESKQVTAAIPGAVQVTGADSKEFKRQTMLDFKSGKIRVVVTKGAIWGWGLNLYHCNRWAHLGLSDSFEMMFQCDRRTWRFGQTEECECYIFTSETEGPVVRNIDRKEREFESMNASMVEHMRDEMNREIHGATTTGDVFQREIKRGEGWTAILGDCVEELQNLKTDSIHYSIFSPPFAALYTYSASTRDMGNSDGRQFMKHFGFAVQELYRVTMPGRLVSFHCMNLPTSKERDGYIGIKDFRGDLIRLFMGGEAYDLMRAMHALEGRLIDLQVANVTTDEERKQRLKRIAYLDLAIDGIRNELTNHTTPYGFIYDSEVVIWKDPLVAASRTHALGLAHKQIVKDAAMCRQGIPDYLVTMRKPGENPEPVEHKPRGFERYIGEDPEPKRTKSATARENKYSHEVWQRYASPVWMDINPSDTLQRESAREERDERHICPLQLQVIERGIEMWTNPGDLVLSPFMGIGSEGYVAIKHGRRFLGMELKRSYFRQSHLNLSAAEKAEQHGLFANADAVAE